MPIEASHIGVWTRDLDLSAEFWRKYFQAQVGQTYSSARRPGFQSRFITLPGCSVQIELMTGPWIKNVDPAERIGYDHLALSLDTPSAVDALAARCAADGCLASPPRWTGDGFYEAVITTPDGMKVEVVLK